MEILYPRCAGLDVHKDIVMARVRCVSEPAVDETRSFATTTGALIELQEWLSSYAATHVAMEATGVYWKPVWHLLEEHFELVLANAQHIKNVFAVATPETEQGYASGWTRLCAGGLTNGGVRKPEATSALRVSSKPRYLAASIVESTEIGNYGTGNPLGQTKIPAKIF